MIGTWLWEVCLPFDPRGLQMLLFIRLLIVESVYTSYKQVRQLCLQLVAFLAPVAPPGVNLST